MKRISQVVLFSIVLYSMMAISIIRVHAQADSATTSTTRNNWGIGVKFNNPSGISVKKYFGNHAIEVNIGRIKRWNHHLNYYMKYDFEHLNEDYFYDYLEVTERPVALQVHYLKHEEISKSFPGFSYYYGAGAQVRTGRYSYHYFYYDQADTKIYGSGHKRYFGCGVDGVLGLDYTFRSVPFTLFVDMNVYVEAFNQPFYTQIRTGSGIRYNF